MNQRLQQFLFAENITQAQFAETINVARASVSHILSGRNKPGFDFISSMVAKYPTLNVEWLITGKGKMYKSPTQEAEIQPLDAPAAAPATSTEAEVQASEEENRLKSWEEADLLFPDSETKTAPAIAPQAGEPSPIPQPVQAAAPVKKRKAVKVVVFYDDDTYQEF